MSRRTISYASPKIVKNLAKVFGKSFSAVKVTMRANKDVSSFIRKVEAARKRAAKSRLHFA